MIELDDRIFPLTQAPRHFPGPAPKPHVSTFVRWAQRGVGKDRIKLETIKIGGRRYTSRAALLRFVAQLSGEATQRELLAQERSEAMHRAERELDADGI